MLLDISKERTCIRVSSVYSIEGRLTLENSAVCLVVVMVRVTCRSLTPKKDKNRRPT